MRLFPELVIEKLGQGIPNVLVTRSRIIGSLRIIDQIMQSRPLLRVDIENRRVISFGVLRRRVQAMAAIRRGRCLPRAECDEVAPLDNNFEPRAFLYLYKIAHFGSIGENRTSGGKPAGG